MCLMTEKQKILIVEDDLDIAESLKLFYLHHNYLVKHISDGAIVVKEVSAFLPDLIILDIMLPNQDGVTCCKNIRQFSNVPIIMLTAKVDQGHKHEGLVAGADDYVCKPFDVMELVLRTKAIISRTYGQVSYSKVSVNQAKAQVSYQGKNVVLSTIEFNLFYLLFSHPERIYSREDILHLAYPQYRHITDRTIDSHVKKIRNKFKELNIDENPIESIYGAGYRYGLK